MPRPGPFDDHENEDFDEDEDIDEAYISPRDLHNEGLCEMDCEYCQLDNDAFGLLCG